MNTFAYIGSIRDKPIVKCVYQTDVNENKFIIKGDGQAEDGGVGINKEAKKLQTDYFYKYNTSLNGLMIHHDIPPEEFLKYVHTIDLSFMKEDKIMRNELEKLDMEKFIFTNGSWKYR